MKQIHFRSWVCKTELGTYDNERMAISLVDIEDNSRIAIATVNVPDVDLDDDEVIIKDSSENEGMLTALINANIISEPLRYVKAAYTECAVCRVLIV